MKIAFIPSTFLPIYSGAEIQSHNIANRLSEKNYKIEVWNSYIPKIKNNKYNLKKFNNLFVNLIFFCNYYLNLNLKFFLKVYFKFLIKNNFYDVWHFQSLNFKTLLYLDILISLKQKTMVTFHGADIQINKKINYGYRLDSKYDFLLRKVIKKVDVIQAISKTIYNDLIKLNVKKSRIVILPNSIFTPKFKLRKKKNKKFSLITVARFAEKKKGFDFIKDISNQLINIIDFQWIFVGRGVSNLKNYDFVIKNPKYFKLIEEIDDNNEFYFPHSKLINLYKNSDLYVHLSRIESFGVSIIEAMASGLPILSFKSKGGEELVKNKINGFKIESFNTKNFAKKIIFLAKLKKSFFNPLKIKNNIKVYDLDRNTKKLTDCYKKLNTL